MNPQASVVAASEEEVSAPPEVVWDVISNIEGWPSWNPEVKSASLEGQLEPGSEFRWKAGPGTITSRLQEVQAPAHISWTGKTMGIEAGHVWRIQATEQGSHVETEESWEGLLPRLLKGPARKMLKKSLDSGIQHLKIEAERRAGS